MELLLRKLLKNERETWEYLHSLPQSTRPRPGMSLLDVVKWYVRRINALETKDEEIIDY